jgi:transposase
MNERETTEQQKERIKELEESLLIEKKAHEKTKKDFEDTKKEYEDTKKDFEDTKKEYEDTKKDFEDTKKEYEDTKKDFEDTKKEFEEFKAKHATTVEKLRKALKIRASKIKIPKHVGAREGHTGYTRRVPERIDYIKPLHLKKCPHCRTPLGKTVETRSRHVTDLVPGKIKTTRYDIHRKYCPCCKKLVEPEVPNVLPRARFGLNLMLLIMYLRLGMRLPGNKVREYLQQVYQLNISEGEIVHVLNQLARAFGDHYSTLEKIVKLAPIKYTDSTSWRVNGRNYHAWVFIGAGTVLYKIRKRNNHRVSLALFGRKQKGITLVVDRHAAFRTLTQKAGFLLQLCWSHILQDSKDLAKNYGKDGKYIHRKLKELYAMAQEAKTIGTDIIVEQIKGELHMLTQRHYKSLTVWKFVKNLYNRDGDNLFRFVTNPEIDPTNNISERELRHLVIIRKISNGSRSPRGAAATAMLLSIIQTLRMKKENVLQGLQNILKNTSQS